MVKANLEEDPDSINSQHPNGSPQASIHPISGHLWPLLAFVDTAHMWYTNTHANKTLRHVK